MRHRAIEEDMQLEEIEKIANGKGLIFLSVNPYNEHVD